MASATQSRASTERKPAARSKKPSRRRAAPNARAAQTGARRWSKHVMETSNALDLSPGVFKQASAAEVARSLKRSADRSERRKAEPFRSAMSMLNFYINRAGATLPDRQRRTLERAKNELRKLYGKPPR